MRENSNIKASLGSFRTEIQRYIDKYGDVDIEGLGGFGPDGNGIIIEVSLQDGRRASLPVLLCDDMKHTNVREQGE